MELRCPSGLVISARDPERQWWTRSYRFVLSEVNARNGPPAGSEYECVVLFTRQDSTRRQEAMAGAQAVNWLPWRARFAVDTVTTAGNREADSWLYVKDPRSNVWVAVTCTVPAKAYPRVAPRLRALYRSFRFLRRRRHPANDDYRRTIYKVDPRQPGPSRARRRGSMRPRAQPAPAGRTA